jgi:hypothetical protein
MSIDKRILIELEKYNKINKYITEQELGVDEPEETPTEEPTTDTDVEEIPEPVDVKSDPDVEVVGDEGGTEIEAGVEELDITDLVNKQNEISDKQDEYMDGMFQKLDILVNKLGEMDQILTKINSLEDKIEKYREKTPQEKLELRSLDSYPYNQKLSDFFQDKSQELEKTGKNEYVLTTDEVQSFTDRDIRDSFDKPFKQE